MKNKFLPYLILICALGLGITAAYYSIIGLSMLFAGVALPVMIMASFLEASKLTIATLLHNYWSKLNILLKTYLTTAVIILSIITSAGIYGLLSSGYQSTVNKSNIIDQKISALETKKQSYTQIKDEYLKDKESLSKSTYELRSALSKNTVLQSVDKKGNIITRESKNNRKAFEQQLTSSLKSEEQLASKIDIINDSIFNLESQILNIKAGNELANELGPLKYLSNLTGQPMDKVINWFLIIIMLVFDPLAISLIVAANFAFSQTSEQKIEIQESEPESQPEPEPKPEPQPIIQQMKEMLQRTDVSSWRKNRIREQLPTDDNVKEY